MRRLRDELVKQLNHFGVLIQVVRSTIVPNVLNAQQGACIVLKQLQILVEKQVNRLVQCLFFDEMEELLAVKMWNNLQKQDEALAAEHTLLQITLVNLHE